jgi:phosphotriesterase-related protein
MSKINTVTGAVPVEKLGRVLIHEHITFGYPGCQGDSRYLTKEHYEDGVRTAVDMCRKVKAQGIQTIVDATTNDCARNPEFLKRVSEEAEINIICTSGY